MTVNSESPKTGHESAYRVEACLHDVWANRVIDDLFTDLDSAEYDPEESLAESDWLDNPFNKPRTLDVQALDPREQDTALLVPYVPGEAPSPQTLSPKALPSKERPLKPFIHSAETFSGRDRLLMGVGIASFIVSAGLWIASLQRSPVTAVLPPMDGVDVNPQDVEFARYMEEALTQLSRQSVALAQEPGATGTPTITVPGAGNPNGTTNGVERVYVPVYQPQPPEQVSIPTLPNPGNGTSSAMTSPQAAVAPAPPPPTRTLVGVLELDQRSVAMIEMNGSTERVSVGQTLDGGWKLVQVSDQRAVLQRGGEVRSIGVGQKF
ncbi:hypothetical protein L3556_06995 [Candidatus Synechococcus calcipolaris G9]|uniref:Type II secretion system protein GspC N-terminal domain-containing protein n=1 Tax=Candidatus Synechococcus calcipolaris G9 TaxID=1497997 RepID=A0ABT6EYQ1_9SYNE|nr:hypothetical protein [Candidatus Synechococcus calcipolaris]MDG2990679.1 hypothetical protein [Candidatus Synechococcus calcipolaris G9]